MDEHIRQWLDMALRWFHVIAGIAWIGSSFFFMWLDSHLEEPLRGKQEGVEGELWMVHSGGFYQVDKFMVTPDAIPPNLHWFKWEAGLTLISGFLLLIVVFYLGGGVLLVDPTVSDISVNAAIALGIGTLVVGWFAYDALFASPLGQTPIAAPLGAVALVGIAWGLSQVMSPRAAYIHTGALMGTCMAANVWMRILPAQRELIRANEAGEPQDPTPGKRAKQRSVHNNYLTLPLVFIMVSNHYPNTYGHDEAWLVLAALMVVGAGIRHMMNQGWREQPLVLGATVLALAGFMYLTGPTADEPEVEAAVAQATAEDKTAEPLKPIVAAETGTIAGVALFTGEVPEAKRVSLSSGCKGDGDGKMTVQPVLVKDGKLKDVFVRVTGGHEAWEIPPPPTEPVEVDQVGCVYVPHVVGVRAKQTMIFINSDPLPHNVHSKGKRNKSFNRMMPNQGMRLERTFKRPEVMVQARCDVHPWMGAHIGVVDHPWFAVSAEDGAFRLEGLPPGSYTLEAWHETLGKKELKVDVVAAGEAATEISW